MFVPDRATHYLITKETGSRVCRLEFFQDKKEAKYEFDKIVMPNYHTLAQWGPVSELPGIFANPDNQHLRDAVQAITDNKHKLPPTRSKYHREIKPGVWVDVYETCGAFLGAITDPMFCRIRTSVEHAVKKLLAPGARGHKEMRQDLEEARESISRAIEQIDEWV